VGACICHDVRDEFKVEGAEIKAESQDENLLQLCNIMMCHQEQKKAEGGWGWGELISSY
jgi:hypothetical protein